MAPKQQKSQRLGQLLSCSAGSASALLGWLTQVGPGNSGPRRERPFQMWIVATVQGANKLLSGPKEVFLVVAKLVATCSSCRD